MTDAGRVEAGADGVEDFGAELTDFRRRVAELRSARALPAAERLPALDAALFELQHAAEVLWPRYQALAAAAKRGGAREDTHEQQLLRALFQRLPVAVVLLDREGVVRRLNTAATQLFGMRPGYAAGRALSLSFAHEARAAFRTQVAAVARGEGARGMSVPLLRSLERAGQSTAAGGGATGDALRVTLTALRPPGESRTSVLALCQPAVGGASGPASTGLPREADRPAPEPAALELHTELLDLVDDLAAALLSLPPADPALPERAAAVLRGRFADWVVVDVLDGRGGLRRAAVAGPEDPVREEFARQDPAAAPLVAEAVERATAVLHARVADGHAFGRDRDGAPLLVRVEADSLLCVPLADGGAAPAAARGTAGPARDGEAPHGPGEVHGVLSLFRTGDRRAFSLAEAAAADRMARHLGLALRRGQLL